ncbi:MAG: non-canonical purine NTP diphosphatase [Flavobacteriaceae bacterium]|nr:non-canonical purine NTP diphosphatase [Flavobacteriaceae bacterium]
MKLVFATNNPNKLIEVKALLPQYDILSLQDIGCFSAIPETEDTIKGNAILKAEYVLKNYSYNCFADDTGLEVGVLNGAPGVYSARYAGPNCNAEDNMQKLLKALKGNANRQAQFKTVVALTTRTKTLCFEGICKGSISTHKLGSSGFGYDPIFIPMGSDKSFAEMSLEEKSAISHRGKAVQQLIIFLQTHRKL